MKDDVQSKIIFQKRDNIGVNDAEDDTKFLIKCFVDNGDFGLMSDYSNPKCLLLGRTGIGKTALISKLKTDKGDRVIIINPEALAMQHITNSTIIRYMHE